MRHFPSVNRGRRSDRDEASLNRNLRDFSTDRWAPTVPDLPASSIGSLSVCRVVCLCARRDISSLFNGGVLGPMHFALFCIGFNAFCIGFDTLSLEGVDISPVVVSAFSLGGDSSRKGFLEQACLDRFASGTCVLEGQSRPAAW